MKKMSAKQISELLREEAGANPQYIRSKEGKKIKRPIEPILMGAGRTKFLYDTSSCDLSFRSERFEKEFIGAGQWQTRASVKDPLRAITGKFWTWNKKETKVVFLEDELKQAPPLLFDFDAHSFSTKEKSDAQDKYLPVKDEVFLLRAVDSNRIFYDAKDPLATLTAIINGGKVEDKHFKKAIQLGVWFEDHTLRVDLPYQRREIESLATSASLMFAHINPTYNFYIPEYEMILGSGGVLEPSLPSMYVMLSSMLYEPDANKPQSSPNPWFDKHITLCETLRKEDQRSMMLPRKDREKFNIRATPAGQYYDMWAKQYAYVPETKLSKLNNKFSNIMVSHSNVDILKGYNSKKEMFPMYVDIEFSTDITTEFASLLEDSNMSCVLMNDVYNSRFTSKKKFMESSESSIQVSSDLGESVVLKKPNITADYKLRKVMDMTDWFNNFMDSGTLRDAAAEMFEFRPEDNAVFLGSNEDSKKMSSDPKYDFYKSLMAIIFSGRIRQLAGDRTRTYADMMGGKPAHTETVMYRIEKRAGGPNGAVLQNFYLPNSNKIDIHSFVDTQVKYGKRYTYTIFAYELVYGSKYRYVDTWIENGVAGVTVRTKPSIKMIEIPYHEYTNRLLDSPPVSPDIEMVPYRGVNDRLKINFRSNVGKYNLMPQTIEPKEKKVVDLLLASQDRFGHEPLQYESDDHCTQFEVWRLTEHPTSYKDFAGHKTKVVLTDVDPETPQRPTSASLIESLKPNKKYWYTFRSIDNHGHVSYPTPIYQVEMVDDKGTVYPIIEVVDFALKTPKRPTKAMKRMMQIVPTLGQGMLNEEKSDLVEANTVLDRWDQDNYFLSVEDEALWGKRFKIRLTSKKTGRKVDLNIRFEHKHLKIEPE